MRRKEEREGKWEGGKEVEKCEYQRVTKKLKSKGKGKDVREIYNNKRQGDRKVLENDRVRKRERAGEREQTDTDTKDQRKGTKQL